MLTPVSLSNLAHITESTLIFILINLEIEPPILESHTALVGKNVILTLSFGPNS